MWRRLVIVWLALAGCSGRPQKVADDAPLRVGSGGDVKAPLPYSNRGFGATIRELVFPGLVRAEDNGTLQPMLAERPYSPDGVHFHLSLHADARFADGSPVTCDDVVAAYRRAKQQPGMWGDDPIARIDCKDAQTVVVKPTRPGRFSEWFKSGVGKGGGETIGAGPFVVASAQPDRLLLRANPHAMRPPGMNAVEFLRFDQSAEAWARLLGGEVDLITHVPWAKAEVIRSIGSVALVETLSKTVVVIDFVHPRPPLDEKKVRYALSIALDRDAIRRSVFRDHAEPAVGVVWPKAPDFHKTLSPYPSTRRRRRRTSPRRASPRARTARSAATGCPS